MQHGFDPYADSPDTGSLWGHIKHAVSSAAHGVEKGVNSAANVAIKGYSGVIGGVANKVIPGSGKYISGAINPAGILANAAKRIPVVGGAAAALADNTTYARTLGANSLRNSALSTLNAVRHPNFANLANSAMTTLKSSGPIGMVASGALGAMQAGLQGKNLESIAWAAAEGAAPSGIDKAIKAAEGLRHGASILTTALNAASGSFLPGTPELLGFNSAIATLKAAANKVALGAARSALPSEGARRAFDAAVGVISKSASGAPSLSSLVSRAGSIPNIIVNKAPAILSATPSATQAVVDAVRRNPALMAGNRQLLAQAMRTNSATVNDAMKIAGSRGNLLPWKSLAPHVVSFVQKYAPHSSITSLRHSHTNVGGLDATGTTYIVEKGDGPWAIAQKLSGNGNNWKMLLDYNKDKNPTVDKNVWVGEVLNLPPSWQKPVAKPTNPATPALPLPPVSLPTIAPPPSVIPQVVTGSIVPSILQAKAILAAWGKTDGINQAGVSDYGLNPADMATNMGPRDTLQLASFQAWDNKTLGDALNTSGNLDAPSLQALQSWATARATQALPGGVVPGATPAVTPVVTGPGVPGVSSPIPPFIPGFTPPATVIPTVIGGTAPPSPTPAVATPSAPATGGSGTAIAIGAVVGGLLFGVPGALIGGTAGAAIG